MGSSAKIPLQTDQFFVLFSVLANICMRTNLRNLFFWTLRKIFREDAFLVGSSAKIPLKTAQRKVEIRSGETPNNRQTSIDETKTSTSHIKSERDALAIWDPTLPKLSVVTWGPFILWRAPARPGCVENRRQKTSQSLYDGKKNEPFCRYGL